MGKRRKFVLRDRKELGKYLEQDVGFFIKELQKARKNKIITEDEYINYVINLKRYIYRFTHKIIKNTNKDKEAD